jgi:response regulator containing a cheY-like receiver domain and an HTH DNA-binding domain
MKNGKYSVMIVEDQQMPKTLFSHYINSSNHFYLQIAIENASIADIVCTKMPVDLILMDVVTENGESGLVAAEKIKKKFPNIKIIIVTSMPECSYIKRAKKIGVEGFWYKEINEQPILSIMEKVINGEIVYPEQLQPVKVGLASSNEFTEKELIILRLILGGYSNVEIAQKLGVSPGVIKNHVANMLLKTGFRSRTQLAVRARETGLVILDKADDEI